MYNKTKGENAYGRDEEHMRKDPGGINMQRYEPKIQEKETSTQIFIRQVIEEHFNRLENKGEESMEKRTLAVQVTEELFQRVKWAVAKEGIKQKTFTTASSKWLERNNGRHA